MRPFGVMAARAFGAGMTIRPEGAKTTAPPAGLRATLRPARRAHACAEARGGGFGGERFAPNPAPTRPAQRRRP
jgi:hypothetical protein